MGVNSLKYDLSYLSIPLPEDVSKLKYFGDFKGANALIDFLLERKSTPISLRKRLEIEKDVLGMMGNNEYPYSFEEARQMMTEDIKDFKADELVVLRNTGKVDWIYVDGEVKFQRRFLANLFKTQSTYSDRRISSEDNAVEVLRQQELDENVVLMKEKGKRQVEITIKGSIKIKKEHERVGEKVKVYLPIPKACKQNSEIKIIRTSPTAAFIAPEDEEQRTIYFETILEENQVFEVTYSYVHTIPYRELDPDKAMVCDITTDLEEVLPHMAFTPYLENLLEEILEGETNPIKQARKIFDFVTTKVNYSFMREYFTIENISEYAAVNLKGDCGVQAILFITLCRMSGIPAKWQSGLYVSSHYTGCHDWAQFYVAPYGWVHADLSFAGGAYRNKKLERWNYYFGNLDVFRMVANSAIQQDFNPAKAELRADPIDNQRGEFEYVGQGLPYACLEVSQELVEMKELN